MNRYYRTSIFYAYQTIQNSSKKKTGFSTELSVIYNFLFISIKVDNKCKHGS